MEGVLNILRNIPIPRVYKAAYTVPTPQLADPAQTLREALHTSGVLSRLRRGMRIAITVGSRGIEDKPLLVRALVTELRARDVEPFIIPAMGSHGGAVAEGQQAMVERLGFSESAMGAPIFATMDVVQVGTSPSGIPVYVDRFAHEADGVILINRIKAHTTFQGPIESGLAKMAVIGLGKQKGAEVCHELGFDAMADRLMEIAPISIAAAPVLFGIGIIENANHRTAELHVLPAADILSREPELLLRSKELLARVPFPQLDVLAIDEIGKNISGTGMDPNVVGRYPVGIGVGGPKVTRICALDITDASHGNGNGLGLADYTTERAFRKFDFAETYPNSLTSTVPLSVKIPMVLPTDRLAIQAAIKSCLIWNKEQVRFARIKNTMELATLEVCERMRAEVEADPRLNILAGPYPLPFNAAGDLL